MDPLRERDEMRGQHSTLRVFFALELAPPVRDAVDELVRRLHKGPGGERVRWVKAESLHVTLRFLGAVATTRIAEIVSCVAAETGRIPPLQLRLTSARIFPSAQRPRAVALGVEPALPLATLATAVESGVVAAGFAPESRPFHPHLTLGRISPRADFPSVTAPDTPVADAFDVTEVLLFRSDLHPNGARYTPLERVPLGCTHGAA